jgi:hypothetical protein
MSLQAPILAQRWLVLTRSLLAGFTRPLTIEAKLAIHHVDDLQNTRKLIESIRLEYDVDLGIDLEEDLKILDVALAGVRGFLESPTSDERTKIEACIFQAAAFEKVRDIYDWSKEHKKQH